MCQQTHRTSLQILVVSSDQDIVRRPEGPCSTLLVSRNRAISSETTYICAAIKDNRQSPRRMYTSAECVNDKFSYTDQDSSDTLVTNAQDLLTVAYDYKVNILGISPLLNVVFDTLHIVDIAKTPFGSSENLGIIGYGLTLSGSIDDGEHLL